MTADKIALKAELYNLFVNLGFGAAYIGNEGPRLQVWPEGGQILGVVLHRGA